MAFKGINTIDFKSLLIKTAECCVRCKQSVFVCASTFAIEKRPSDIQEHSSEKTKVNSKYICLLLF